GSRAVVVDRAHDRDRLQQLPVVPRPRHDPPAVPLARMSRLATVALGIVALTAVFATPALADEGWVIERFAADITVGKDASLHITEAIDVDFGGLQKHGIFRTIPVRYQ